MAMREITYREALKEALREEMKRDERVFLMGEDIADPFGGAYKVTLGLSSEFGTDRVMQTPISELGYIGAALGAALTGMRPVAELMYIDFATMAMDQIANQAAKIRYMSGGQARVPLVIRTQGGLGRSSAAHHAQSLEAWFVHLPGFLVAMPSTPYDAKGLLKTAVRDDNPVLFLENAMLYNDKGDVPQEDYTVPFGQARIAHAGKDVTVVTYSRMVREALKATGTLETQGISAEVIDLRTLIPLDWETVIGSVKKTGRAVVVHEAYKKGGVGGDIASEIVARAFDYLDAPVMRIGAKDAPIPFSRPLEEAILPGPADIVEACKALVA